MRSNLTMAIVCETEVTSSVPPAKMFKAFVLDAHIIFPKVVPHAIRSVEILGDGGPGSIKLFTFGESSKFKYVKHRIDEIDEDTMVYNYTVVEGDALKDSLEKISFETKLEDFEGGGSMCKITSKYYPKEGGSTMSEEETKATRDHAYGIFKIVEAYLIANPDAYN